MVPAPIKEQETVAVAVVPIIVIIVAVVSLACCDHELAPIRKPRSGSSCCCRPTGSFIGVQFLRVRGSACVLVATAAAAAERGRRENGTISFSLKCKRAASEVIARPARGALQLRNDFCHFPDCPPPVSFPSAELLRTAEKQEDEVKRLSRAHLSCRSLQWAGRLRTPDFCRLRTGDYRGRLRLAGDGIELDDGRHTHSLLTGHETSPSVCSVVAVVSWTCCAPCPDFGAGIE